MRGAKYSSICIFLEEGEWWNRRGGEEGDRKRKINKGTRLEQADRKKGRWQEGEGGEKWNKRDTHNRDRTRKHS